MTTPPPPTDTPGLIIAGIIGAGAAIVVQIISSVVTSRRDKQRFNWERDRQERDWQMRERERFLDLKRDLYSNFTYQVSILLGHIHINNDPDAPVPAPLNMEELRKLQWNIDLIAPQELARSVAHSLGALITANETTASEHVSYERRLREEDEAERKWWDTYDLLREDLLGPEPHHVPVRRPDPGPPPPRPAGPVTSSPKFKAWREYRKMLRAYRRTVDHQHWWHRFVPKQKHP